MLTLSGLKFGATRSAAAAILAIGCLVGGAAAMTDFPTLLSELDSDVLAQRDRAAQELRRLLSSEVDPDAAKQTEAQIAQAMREGQLSLEQRLRLQELMYENFVRTPRAAIGVQFVIPQIHAQGVELGMLFEGFPAKDQGLLQPGDVITQVDGMSLLDNDAHAIAQDGTTLAQNRLRSYIISHEPGDVVKMTVVRRLPSANPQAAAPRPDQLGGVNMLITEGPGRNAEIVTMRVPLGSFSQLRNGAPFPNDNAVEEAFARRLERLGVPPLESPSVSTGVDRRQWFASARTIVADRPFNLNPAAEAPGAFEHVESSLPVRTELADAGGAVQAAPRLIQGRPMNPAQKVRMRVVPNDPVFQLKGRPPVHRAEAPLENALPQLPAGGGPRALEIANLLNVMSQLQAQADEAVRRAKDDTLSEADRRTAAEELEDLQARISSLDSAVRRVLEQQAKPAQKP